jgi:hypothetical protein
MTTSRPLQTLRRLCVLLAFAGATLAANDGRADEARARLIAEVAQSARALVAALPPERQAAARLPFQGSERTSWRYTPGDRAGLALKDMSPAQREAAHALLQSFLSANGYLKVQAIIALESVLRELEGRSDRDPGRYWFAVFGEPGGDAPWGLRVEGHHVSLHLTVVKGRFLAATPTFLGANPAEVRAGPRKGERALRDEEEAGRALLASLTPAQRREAIVGTGTYGDIATGNASRADVLEQAGIAFAQLSVPQQQLLLGLIELHAATMKTPIAAERLARIRAAGLEGIRFAWAGSTERGRGHYFRVQGPTFLIEFDNSGGDHIHTVWRDFNGDFGRDLLREHYGTAAHAGGRQEPRR